jgi:DnaJ-class molecular chaperone
MAAQDPYIVLGVSENATQDEIRKAYRNLAKKYHPDVNQGNAEVEKRFAEIGEAYELVGTKEARKEYEQRRTTARRFQQARSTGARNFSEGSHNFEQNFGDIFSQFFSGAGSSAEPSPAPDVEYSLEIGFEESVIGSTRRVTLKDGRTVDLSIPAGIENGTRLRLPANAAAVGRRQSGSAYITVTVRDSDRYKRTGDDLEITLPVAIHEAILGAKVPVETPSGKFNVQIPPGTTSGKKLRLRGKGVKPSKKTNAGDLIVEIAIMLPEKIDEELHSFIELWSKSHAYDPR